MHNIYVHSNTRSLKYEKSQRKKRAGFNIIISILIIIMLGIPGASCNQYRYSERDKQWIHEIAFADSTVKELVYGKEYEEEWQGALMSDDFQTKLAGIIEITFTEPFYADRDWPQAERYETRDPVSNKLTGYAYAKKINHEAIMVKKLQVAVYLLGEKHLVAISPIAEGQ